MRCKEQTDPPGAWAAMDRHQCTRNAKRDGYCAQHHPDAVQARANARRQKDHAEARQAAKERNLRDIGVELVYGGLPLDQVPESVRDLVQRTRELQRLDRKITHKGKTG